MTAPRLAPASAGQSREREGARFSVEEGWGEGRAGNYNERRGLQSLPGLPRAVRLCGTVSRVAGGVDVDRELREVQTGRARYRGECYCKSVTGCAVCRSSKMAKWAEILVCHIDALRDRGGGEALLTFTIPHRGTDDLRTLHEILRCAYRDTFSGAGWAAIAKQYGYLGSARVLETTWSPYAGHHPHVHSLACFARPLGDAIGPFQVAVTARFTRMLCRQAARLGFDLLAVDVDRVVSVKYVRDAGQYLTKMGLAEELTAPGTKVGRAVHGVYHLTMPQLARRLAWARLRYGPGGPTERARDRRRFASDTQVFLQYVDAMRGQQVCRIAPGLAAAINALPLRSDVVPELSTMAGVPADEEPVKTEHIYHFSPTEWRRFTAAGPLARVEMERLIEQEGAPAEVVRAFIADVLAKRWRPKRDPVWGEDADSPLFAEDKTDADGVEGRSVRPVRPAPVAGRADGDVPASGAGHASRDDQRVLHGGVSGDVGVGSSAGGRARPRDRTGAGVGAGRSDRGASRGRGARRGSGGPHSPPAQIELGDLSRNDALRVG